MKFQMSEKASERDWWEAKREWDKIKPSDEDGPLDVAERWMELLDRAMEATPSVKIALESSFQILFEGYTLLPRDFILESLLIVSQFWVRGEQIFEGLDPILRSLVYDYVAQRTSEYVTIQEDQGKITSTLV